MGATAAKVMFGGHRNVHPNAEFQAAVFQDLLDITRDGQRAMQGH